MSPRIELTLKNISLVQFKQFLADYFEQDVSPEYPIAVFYYPEPFQEREFSIFDHGQYKIVGFTQDVRNKFEVLADINFREYYQILVILFESGNDGARWEDVKRIVQKIIGKAQRLQIQIVSVDPSELLPAKSTEKALNPIIMQSSDNSTSFSNQPDLSNKILDTTSQEKLDSYTGMESSKKGPTTYPDEIKIGAIKEWFKKKEHTQTLEAFLADKFGKYNGILIISPSTFYSWRKKYRDEGRL